MDKEDAITTLGVIALVIVTVSFIIEYSRVEVDTCGNKICDIHENSSNCEEDCGSSMIEKIVFLDSTDTHFISEEGSGYESLPYKWIVNGYPKGGGLELITHIGMLNESRQYYLDWNFDGQGWWKMTVSASNDGKDWTYLYYACSWRTGTDCSWDSDGNKQVLIPKVFYEDLYLRFSPSNGNGERELIYLDKLIRISTERDYSKLERTCPLEIEENDKYIRYEWSNEEGCVGKIVDPCGNGRCDHGENCLICPEDCRCGYNQICIDGECVRAPPRCGDRKCDANETCQTCPVDCRCSYGYECVDGECVKEILSVDLPDKEGMTWNLSYTPGSDRIKISSSRCFYLDIFDSEGNEIDPYDADVEFCTASGGKIYSTTGKNSASWFNWGGCASTKYYEVEKGDELTLRIHTDSCPSCVCYHPDFNIYEEIDGRWVKYRS